MHNWVPLFLTEPNAWETKKVFLWVTCFNLYIVRYQFCFIWFCAIHQYKWHIGLFKYRVESIRSVTGSVLIMMWGKKVFIVINFLKLKYVFFIPSFQYMYSYIYINLKNALLDISVLSLRRTICTYVFIWFIAFYIYASKVHNK